jgi:hypothetical protein
MSGLLRWTTGEPIRATAEQIARYGPQAGRLLDLVRRIPMLGGEARDVVRLAEEVPFAGMLRSGATAGPNPVGFAERELLRADYDKAMENLLNLSGVSRRGPELDAVYEDISRLTDVPESNPLSQILQDAGQAEVLSDVLMQRSPETYRVLTRPLAIGSTTQTALGDLLNSQRENFLSNLFPYVSANRIQSPQDVLALRDISRLRDPQTVEGWARTFLEEGRARNVKEALAMALAMGRDLGV